MGEAAAAPSRLPGRELSSADQVMHRLLLIPADAPRARQDSVHRIFNVSILISALRCLLSYVVFPVVSPVVGAASGVGPSIGVPIAVVALVFDVMGIRRFWLAGHRWRWPMTLLYLTVMGLVSALLVGDVFDLTRH